MSALIATKNKKDVFEDNRNVDIDDFTSSSILEFLNKERECFNGEDASEIDVDSLFEEINRLSDNTDERSVDEILREAENLISKQPLINGCGGSVVRSRDKNEFKKVIEAVCPDSAISEESTPRDMKANSSDVTPDDDVSDCFETITLQIIDVATSGKSFDNDDVNYPSTKTPTPPPSIDSASKPISRRTSSPVPPQHDNIVPEIFDKQPFTPHESPKNDCTKKRYCDKSTNPSPKHFTAIAITSPIDNFSISREHALKNEIEILQEKLKDTEERLQSLRIQHDSLSQLHRDMRENHTHIQEESELLKLDVQHLTECANILRTELQSARNDRNEAMDVQKILQMELDENRVEKKKVQEQCEKDAKTIQDLHRQCKEMERILMRKHPDSVSALIVASKNPTKSEDTSASRRLLEQRIAQLEADAKEQDRKAQKILANVQARFNSVQSKYETHIADLETQVLSLQEINSKLNEKINSQVRSYNNNSNSNLVNHCTQTDDIAEKETNKMTNSSTQTDSRPNSSMKQAPSKKLQMNKMSVSHSDTTISAYHATAKEDAHLLATIRGMRIDLALKDKAMQRLTRELDECKKTIKKLQKEKEAIKSEKPSSSSSSSSNSRKPYDPSQFSEHSADSQALKEALNKNKLLEFDYKALHDKRLQDLKTLQAAHERELAACQETVRILQQRLAERDEAFAIQKRRKVPIDYYALKAKIKNKKHKKLNSKLVKIQNFLRNK